MRLKIATWLFSSLLLCCGVSHGTTIYYTAKTGNNANTCVQAQNQATPKQTIAAGVGCLAAGDTLIIGDGTYAERLTNAIPSGVSIEVPTIIKAANRHQVILQPNEFNSNFVVQITDDHFITLDGLILDATNFTTEAGTIKIDGDTDPSTYITVQNSELRNVPLDSCVKVGWGTDHVSFKNVDVYNCQGQEDPDVGSDAFYWGGGTNGLIENSRLHDTTGAGVQYFDPASRNFSNVTFRNNVVYNTGKAAVYFGTVQNALVYNNVIYNAANGFGYSTSQQAFVYHNTVFNTTFCIRRVGGGNLIQAEADLVKNNIFWQCGTGAVATDNFTSDPDFVDGANGDLRLSSSSGAIDGATRLDEVLTDALGVFRGAMCDFGAYESVSSISGCWVP